MKIAEKLASALGKRDEQPNIELAEFLAKTADAEAIVELAAVLRDKNKDLQSDAIKVMYELGTRRPDLLVPHAEALLAQLDSKNNRMVWGAMTALDALAAAAPDLIYENLGKIMAAADAGSVIAKDHAVGILIKLAAQPARHSESLELLFDLLRGCPSNELPMYAEQALPVISADFKASFVEILTARLPDFEKESKRARVEKVLKKCQK